MKKLNNGSRLKENFVKIREYNGQYFITLPAKLCVRSGIQHGDIIEFDSAFPSGFRIKRFIIHDKKIIQ